MERLSESLKALVVEIRAELTDMAECGREDRGNLGQLQDEFQKVLYDTRYKKLFLKSVTI